MARRKKGRPVNGVILVDKHQGQSSNQILQQVKWAFNANKAGHTGALDPLATGMLPICLGEATKFSQFLLDTDKTYQVTAKLGVRTTTSDADGEVVSEKPVAVTQTQLLDAVMSFKGDSMQIPSMYSALKHQGRPLYYYARKGIEVPRKSRPISVYAIEMTRFVDHEVDMTVHCSKGTYIRTIVDDLGEKLGCGAHVTMLRRTKVGHYPSDEMITTEQLQLLGEQARQSADDTNLGDYQALDNLLLPIDSAPSLLPAVEVDPKAHRAFSHGNPTTVIDSALIDSAQGLVRVYSQERLFLGVGEVTNKTLAPKRVVNYVQ